MSEKRQKEVYKMDAKYKNRWELLHHALTLYSSVSNMGKGKNHLRPKLLEVLTYYVWKGYSTETKKFILESIPELKTSNLNQINSELQKKGYLVKDKHQDHLRHVSKELHDLKKYLDENDGKKPLFCVMMIDA